MESIVDQWAFSMYVSKNTIFYMILSFKDRSYLKTVFEMQIPLKLKGVHVDCDLLDDDLNDLIDILPGYMEDICKEHNGIKRCSNFPTFIPNASIKYTKNSICLTGFGENIQIGGGHPDDIGENFTRDFVRGLLGDWRGVNFYGCDNPSYREEEE